MTICCAIIRHVPSASCLQRIPTSCLLDLLIILIEIPANRLSSLHCIVQRFSTGGTRTPGVRGRPSVGTRKEFAWWRTKANFEYWRLISGVQSKKILNFELKGTRYSLLWGRGFVRSNPGTQGIRGQKKVKNRWYSWTLFTSVLAVTLCLVLESTLV
jgi:hypothetical protein